MSKLLTEDRLQDMLKHPYKTNWRRVFECFEVTEEQVRRVTKYMDAAAWTRVSHHKCFSESFLREFGDTLGHHILTDNVSTDFIRESSNKITEPFYVPIKNKSEKFYEEFKDHVDWNELFVKGELKEDFIEKWKDKTNVQAIEFKKFIEELLFNLN